MLFLENTLPFPWVGGGKTVEVSVANVQNKMKNKKEIYLLLG